MVGFKTLGLLAVLVFATSAAQAGTTIVNLNASGSTPNTGRNSSPAGYNPINVTLGAGTYTVRLAGIAGGGLYDAMSVYAPTAGNAAYTNAFWSISLNNGTSAAYTQAQIGGTTADFDNSFKAGRYNTASAAYNAYASAAGYTFTLASTQTASFYFDDNPSNDDGGGISLAISAVPEPASLMLLGVGAVGVLVARRRRGRVQAV